MCRALAPRPGELAYTLVCNLCVIEANPGESKEDASQWDAVRLPPSPYSDELPAIQAARARVLVAEDLKPSGLDEFLSQLLGHHPFGVQAWKQTVERGVEMIEDHPETFFLARILRLDQPSDSYPDMRLGVQAKRVS